MVGSIANQEAMERFICQVNTAREKFQAQAAAPSHLRTPPSDHYFIAKHADTSYNITAWLSELKNDPAVTVCNNYIPMVGRLTV